MWSVQTWLIGREYGERNDVGNQDGFASITCTSATA
jgi:hypothetical protein